MDEVEPDNGDMIDLIVQLCTRIGMMMEDVSLVALNASRDGLEGRVSELQGAIGIMAAIADAAEAMLQS